jgi:hypothetical protein
VPDVDAHRPPAAAMADGWSLLLVVT